jgi:hypothetical protein
MAFTLAAVAGAPAREAEACDPDPVLQPDGHYHWYAIIQADDVTGAGHGAAVDINTTRLRAGDPWSDMVNHEMWYAVTGDGQYWVELGFKDGANGTFWWPVDQVFFWADRRNGGGYHEHYPSFTWGLGHYYTLKVVASGSCSWDVYASGQHMGTSTDNCPGARRALEAGIEASPAHSDDLAHGYLMDWRKKDGDDHWSNGWPGVYTAETCPADIDILSSGFAEEGLHGPV